MRIFFFIFGFANCFFLSCNQHNKASDYIVRLNPSDTFLFDYPKKNLQDTVFQKDKKYYDSCLDLSDIRKGFDSIQIRIDYGCALNGSKLIILTNKNDHWSAEIATVRQEYKPGYGDFDNESKLVDYSDYTKVFIVSKISDFKTPKSGWKKFISNLFELNILTLPDYRQLGNIDSIKGAVSDGCGVSVEIATKKAYRFYIYANPDLYNERFPDANNMLTILSLLNSEFGLKVWPDDTESFPENKRSEPREKKPKIDIIELEDIEHE